VAGDALWVTEEGGPFGRGSIQVMIRRLKKDAGLHNVKGSAYKLALHTSLAEDLAARDAEEAIKKGHPLSPEEVELRKGYYLSGIPARLTRMRYHSLEWCTQSNLPPQIRASPGNHPPPGRGLRQGGARLSQG